MKMECAPKSDLELIHLATDFLRRHPQTSGLEVKSLRISNYDRPASDATISIGYSRLRISFINNAEEHEVEFFFEDRRSFATWGIAKVRLIYTVLDGHYDLLASEEIW